MEITLVRVCSGEGEIIKIGFVRQPLFVLGMSVYRTSTLLIAEPALTM